MASGEAELSPEQLAAAATMWQQYAPKVASGTSTDQKTFGLRLDPPTSAQQNPDRAFAEPDCLCCIITGELLQQPVASSTSGHTYERDTLLLLIAANDACPMTRRQLSLRCVLRNRALEAALQAWHAFQRCSPDAAGRALDAPAADKSKPAHRSSDVHDDWLLVTSLSAPTASGGAEADPPCTSRKPTVGTSALTTVPLHDARASLTAAMPMHSKGALGGAGSPPWGGGPVPAFLQCPLAPGVAMQQPVLTAAGWTYDRGNLLAHFHGSAVACRQGQGGFAMFTDPISGMPLHPRQPYVTNVALQDMLEVVAS